MPIGQSAKDNEITVELKIEDLMVTECAVVKETPRKGMKREHNQHNEIYHLTPCSTTSPHLTPRKRPSVMPLQEMMTYVNTIQQCIQVLVDENRKLHALNRSLLCRVKIADQQKEEQEGTNAIFKCD